MHKIWLITKREYLSRVQKKTFIIMTILGPLLIALFYGIIIGLTVTQKTSEKTRIVAVVDKSGLFKNQLKNPNKVQFVYTEDDTSKNGLDLSGWLLIPNDFTLEEPKEVVFKSDETPPIELQGKLTDALESAVNNQKLVQKGVSKDFLDSLKVTVPLKTLEINETGDLVDSRAEVNFVLAFLFAFIIYIFIFLYGVQVMRGVMEEKTNRIVEIIISSVKPFQLMMGKILGIAMVGLTQFLIWVVLSGVMVGLVSLVFATNMVEMSGEMTKSNNSQISSYGSIFDIFLGLNLGFYLIIFLFYFLFGYLLYSSMFAAIGSAVDSESDTQQFMIPVTMPLVISFVTGISVLSSDPNGSFAVFMSIFPLTSPIMMMVRLPFNPPDWELAISMISLVLTFVLFTWLAGRIYKVGILMMGKKPTYKQLFKWMLMK